MELVLCFLANSLFFLLCSGVRYLSSSLVRVFIIPVMKVLSFTTVLALTCLLSLVVSDSDIRAGMVLEDKAGSRSELGNAEDTEVEAVVIDASEYVEEVLEVSSSSEAQKVQLDRARWYVLLAKI